jgi:hypothetical protein
MTRILRASQSFLNCNVVADGQACSTERVDVVLDSSLSEFDGHAVPIGL